MKSSAGAKGYSEPGSLHQISPNYTHSSSIPASSFSHPLLTPMQSKPLASHPQSHGLAAALSTSLHHSSLHLTPQFSAELPPHHVSHTAHMKSSLLTSSAPASSQLHYSTTTSPICHPVLFVPPSTLPEIEPAPIPYSHSTSDSSILPVSTTQEKEDQDYSFLSQAAMNETSKLSFSSHLPLHKAPPVPLPSSSLLNFVVSPETKSQKQTPSISSLSASSDSIGSFSEADMKAELLIKSQNVGEVEEKETLAARKNLFEEEIPLPVQNQNETDAKEEEKVELEESSDEDELNQDDKVEIEVVGKMAHADLLRHEEEEMMDEDRREVDGELEDGENDGKDELEKKLKIGKGISEQYKYSSGIQEENHRNVESSKTDGIEESQGTIQSDVDKESLILDAISTSSWFEHSQTDSKQDKPPIPAPASPSQHMSAYYKMVGQCTAQKTSPVPSLSSEGSELEDDLRLAVTKSLDNQDPDMDDLLSLHDNNPSPNPTVQAGSLALPARTSERTIQGLESRKYLIDNTSLKRRMGKC